MEDKNNSTPTTSPSKADNSDSDDDITVLEEQVLSPRNKIGNDSLASTSASSSELDSSTSSGRSVKRRRKSPEETEDRTNALFPSSLIEVVNLTSDEEEEEDKKNKASSPWKEFKWDDKTFYGLYYQNEDFKGFCQPYVKLMEESGPLVSDYIEKTHHRRATMDEVWNKIFSTKLPSRGWTGVLKIVDPDRKGWPLQHKPIAEVEIRNISFRHMDSDPRIDYDVLKAYKTGSHVTAKVGYEGAGADLGDFSVWQVEPVSKTNEFDQNGPSMDRALEIYHLSRNFFEMYTVGDSGMDDAITYFKNGFYERMKIFFCMQHPCPTSYVLKDDARRQINAAVKKYHVLKNVLLMYVLGVVESDSEFEDEDRDWEEDEEETTEVGEKKGKENTNLDTDKNKEKDSTEHNLKTERTLDATKKYLLAQMQLKRHNVEIEFVMQSQLRELVDIYPSILDESMENYNNILVVQETNLVDLNLIHDELESYLGVQSLDNIRICTNLETALSSCNQGCSLFITSGNYSISQLYKISYGGSLIGVRTACGSDITITPMDSVGDIWLMYFGPKDSSLTIKNINFVVDTSSDLGLQIAFKVQGGKINFEAVNFRNLDVNLKEHFKLVDVSPEAIVEATASPLFEEEDKENSKPEDVNGMEMDVESIESDKQATDEKIQEAVESAQPV